MQLSDLESQVLMALQMPYANPGGTVTWQGEFPQNQVDFAINRAYTRLVSDIGDLELCTQTIIIPTISQQYAYTVQSNATKTAIGSYASATVTFTGTVAAGQTPQIAINGTLFSYTVLSTDTLASIAQAFIAKINASTLVLPTGTILQPVTPTLNTASNVLTLYAGATGTSTCTLSAASSGTLTVTASIGLLSGGTTANQPIRTLRRVWYQPLGQLYRLELEPGARLISWESFNRKTGASYMLSFSASTQPDYCALDPTRQQLYVFPGPYTTGDQITLEYCPIITTNTAIPATNWGYLNNATDVPMLPEDAQDAIWIGAVSFLQPKAREVATGKLYGDLYKDEVQRIKDNYTRDSAGDALVFRPVEDVLTTSGWDSWVADY